MISEAKLKHLDNFINSTTNLDIKNGLTNNVRPNLKNIEDEKLLLKIANIKLRFSETIIGTFNENSLFISILFLSENVKYNIYNDCGVSTIVISKKDYNIYKQQFRLKKINNINKDVICS